MKPFPKLSIGRALYAEDGKKLKRVISQPGLPRRHHIVQMRPGDGYEYTYHATKGWRRERL
ncbi:MAG TPA: hypothetical protein VGN16_09755 [Acidobacteriaceae bacterium]